MTEFWIFGTPAECEDDRRAVFS